MKKRFVSIILLFLVVSSALFAQNQNSLSRYKNPVIAGDFPDPTVIRVGNTYYAAGTSSDFAPHYPLYESKDLINWERIGACLLETPEWASGSFWAPELYYNNGVFYLYYTARRKTDNVSCVGVATTTDIKKGFKDRGIIIDWGKEAIDAFIFKDTDGKSFICWKAYGLNKERPVEILASELSKDGLKLVGKHFSLTRYDEGWVGAGDEGPCLVKKNGYYYLFYSVGGCCDNRCTYRMMVSRSKSLNTGWVQYEGNPILEGGDEWKCSGHGTLVDTPDQRSFFLYHAYNASDFEYIGRQGMLDELIWDKTTGWPYFKNGKTPSTIAEVPFKNTIQLRDTVYSDHFSNAANQKLWQWDLKSPTPEIKIGNGVFTLSSQQKGFVFAGLGTKSGAYTFEATLKERTADFSGISIYGSQKGLIAFGADQNKLVLFQIKGGERTTLLEIPNTDNRPVSFKMEVKNGRFFKFYWSTNREDWQHLDIQPEIVDGSFLPQWGAAMHVGLLLENTENNTAQFSYVQLSSKFD